MFSRCSVFSSICSFVVDFITFRISLTVFIECKRLFGMCGTTAVMSFFTNGVYMASPSTISSSEVEYLSPVVVFVSGASCRISDSGSVSIGSFPFSFEYFES